MYYLLLVFNIWKIKKIQTQIFNVGKIISKKTILIQVTNYCFQLLIIWHHFVYWLEENIFIFIFNLFISSNIPFIFFLHSFSLSLSLSLSLSPSLPPSLPPSLSLSLSLYFLSLFLHKFFIPHSVFRVITFSYSLLFFYFKLSFIFSSFFTSLNTSLCSIH